MASEGASGRECDEDSTEPQSTAGAPLVHDVENLRLLLIAAERRAATLAELTSLMSEGRDPLELAQRSVELTARATRAAGSFIYLWSPEQDRLVLRVATEGWQKSLVDRIQLRLGEGITGWSGLMRQTVVVDRDPLADPRAVEFPELREDAFKSMVAVPILEPGGEVLGVFCLYALHEKAFAPADVNLASEVGALLASGLVQAETMSRLRTQSGAARFLADLPAESYMSLERCLDVLAARIIDHLEAEACVIELTEKWGEGASGDAAVSVSSAYGTRHDLGQDAHPGRSELAELAQRDGLERLRIPLGSAHPVGAITCYRSRRFSREDGELAEAVGAQAAAAVMSLLGRDVVAPVIERLLEPADAESVERLLTSLGWRPGLTRIFAVRTHLSAPADMGQIRRVRAELDRFVAEYPGSIMVSGGQDDLLFISGCTSSRVPDQEFAARLASLRTRPGVRITAGVGPTARTAAMLHPSLRHALTASRWAELAGNNGALVGHSDIAHLRLLPSIALGMSAELRAMVDALAALVTYDLEHGTDLAKTLDTFVTSRGSVARTASQLFIHRNTLRQRLRRIEELTGQCPEAFENWLTAGLAARMIEKSEGELAEVDSSHGHDRCPRGVMTVGASCCGLPRHCALTSATTHHRGPSAASA